jgi:biotin carboxyl carrier protein
VIRYQVEMGGRTVEVSLDSCADGPVHAIVDGAPCEAEVTTAPGGIRLRVGETVLDLVVETKKDDIVLHAPGGSLAVRARSERDLVTAGTASAKAGPSSVRAPMPGRVVSVLVEKGAKVAAGAPVAVVEAMKMENELRAPAAGTVLEVKVTPGQPVEAGEELVRIGE